MAKKRTSNRHITRSLLTFLIMISILVIPYLLLRIFSLTNHNVSYTYDQGRDFLKAAELVDQHNLTFIGPTTGIIGLYHGAWWYYWLTIPYLLFQGAPIGFYLFNLWLHLFIFGLFCYFLNDRLGWRAGLLGGLIMVSSPYFRQTSLFVGNNILTIPFVLLLLISLYNLVEKKEPPLWLFWLNGLALGFIAEFELSFGLFIIPSYFLMLIILPLRSRFQNWLRIGVFSLGLGLAFIPRILFELKNNFAQTRVLLNFLFHPQLHDPKPYLIILGDRLQLFWGYYQSLFNSPWLIAIVSLLVVAMTIQLLRSKAWPTFLNYLLFLLVALFAFSTLYKDNFWGNYYEGIQLIMALVIIVILTHSVKRPWAPLFTNSVLILLVLSTIWQLTAINRTARVDGLRAHELVVDRIQTLAKTPYCLDIYTPPAIPYTYRYLFYYQNRHHQRPLPVDAWQENACWYIIEHDDFLERRNSWIATRIPKEAKLKEGGLIGNTLIQRWQK